MVTIEEELRSAIISDSSVSALVSDRVYANELVPQNAVLPHVVYEFKSTVPDETSFTLDGPGLYRTQFLLSSRGGRWTSSKSVADALRFLLENKKGALTALQSIENIFLRSFTDQGFQAEIECYIYQLEIEIVHK